MNREQADTGRLILLRGRDEQGRHDGATAAPCRCERVAEASRLSWHERVVLAGLVQGESRQAIARQAAVSKRTLERLIASLQERLGAPTLAELSAEAALMGFRRDCAQHDRGGNGDHSPP